MRLLRTAALLALAFAAAPASAQQPAPPPLKVGVNVGGGTSYYSSRLYADLFKQGGPLGNDAQNRPRPIQPYRPDGYPTYVDSASAQPTSIMPSLGEPWPAGDYQISAEGKGRLSIKLAKDWTAQAYFDFDGGGATQTFTAAVPKPANVQINVTITASDAADPLHDIRFVAPDADPGATFTRSAIGDLRGYAILRFMDARKTNGVKHVTWADYEASMLAPSNNDRGIPLEDCAALANETQADPWFNIPHLADDDYVRKMARTIDAALAPDRTIYIEWSNEVWNGIFPQFKYTRDEHLKQPDPKPSLFTYQGILAARRINLFKESVCPRRKVVRVVAAQAGWYGAAKETFVGAKSAGGFDAIACAPYFDGGLTADSAKATATAYNAADEAGKRAILGDLIAGCHESIRTRRALFAEWSKIAKLHGVPLLAYEGGQHITPGGNPLLTPLYTAVNKDPRMGAAYARYLADAEAEGFTAFVLYSSLGQYGNNGTWGLKEYAGQPETPKSTAARVFLGR